MPCKLQPVLAAWRSLPKESVDYWHGLKREGVWERLVRIVEDQGGGAGAGAVGAGLSAPIAIVARPAGKFPRGYPSRLAGLVDRTLSARRARPACQAQRFPVDSRHRAGCLHAVLASDIGQ